MLQSEDYIQTIINNSSLHKEYKIISINSIYARHDLALIKVNFSNKDISYFLKRFDNNESSIDNEIKILKIFEAHPYVKKIVARLLYFDSSSNVAIMEGLSHYQSLRKVLEKRQENNLGSYINIGTEWLIAIAKSIFECHNSFIFSKSLIDKYPDLSLVKPPISSLYNITPTEYAYGIGRDFPIYLKVIQSIDEQIHNLHSSWKAKCLIHNDFHEDNIMLLQSPSQDKNHPVKFVDWELSGWGNPLYDIGLFVGRLLFYWLEFIPIGAEEDISISLKKSLESMGMIRCNIETFVISYLHFAKDSALLSTSPIINIVEYAGIVLLHRALNSLYRTGNLGKSSLICLHVGKNFIANPEQVANLLFTNM